MPISASLLIPLLPKGDVPPLFVIPSSGSTPLSLTALRNELKDSGLPLYSFLPSGIDKGQKIHTSFEEMASAYIREMKEIQPDGPYRIMGHCIGGIAAHEMMRQLEAEEVDGENTLLLLESFPPHLQARKDNPELPAPCDSVLAKEIETLISKLYENLHQQLAYLPPAQAKPFVEIALAQLAMDTDYFATPVRARIHLITTGAHPDEVFLDWEHLTDKAITRRPLPGGTFSILQPPEVSHLADALLEALRPTG